MHKPHAIDRRTFLRSLAGLAAGGALIGPVLARPRPARAAPAKIRDPIKIGHQCVLSGPLGGYGQFMKRGVEMAIEEINAAGGVLGSKLEVEFRDSEVKSDVAVKNARYFVDSYGADFLTGIDSSAVSLAVGEIMPELNRVLITTHASTEKLTEQLVYKRGIKHIFRISIPVYQDGILAALIARDFPAKRWAAISVDYEYGKTAWKMFRETLAKYRPDVEIVAEAWAPFGTIDFGPHIAKVMAGKPEAIYTTEWGGEAVALVKQATLYGVFDRIQAWMNPMGAAMDVLEGLGSEYPTGLWASCRYWFLYPPTAENERFVERFYKRWKVYPHYSSETSYSAMYAIKAAVEKAGSLETDDLIKALEGLILMTPGGRRYFRPEDHQAMYEVPWGKTTEDPRYPIRILSDLRVLPAEMYFRRPPFEA